MTKTFSLDSFKYKELEEKSISYDSGEACNLAREAGHKTLQLLRSLSFKPWIWIVQCDPEIA